MSVRAIGDRIVVKRIIEDVSPGGILLVNGNTEDVLVKGEVLSLGDGVLHNGVLNQPNVMQSDLVCYNKYSAVTVRDGLNEFDVVPCNQIVCVVSPSTIILQ